MCFSVPLCWLRYESVCVHVLNALRFSTCVSVAGSVSLCSLFARQCALVSVSVRVSRRLTLCPEITPVYVCVCVRPRLSLYLHTYGFVSRSMPNLYGL